MKFHTTALITLSFVSAACGASYNPYSFFFYFAQKPCIPFAIHYLHDYKYSNKGGCTRFYGTDLDYKMEIWTHYPPLYIQDAQSTNRDYVNHIEIELYKQKNEEVYHLAYYVSTLGSWTASYRSEDLILSKDTVEQIFNAIQFPIKQFPENTNRYDSYSLSTHSLKELSEGAIFNAFKGLITFVNMALKGKSVEIKLDENDFRAVLDFGKKWLSLTTWNRWID